MSLTLCTYNVEHFNRCFDENNRPSEEDAEKLEAVAEVLRAVGADVVGIVEAPNSAPSGEPPRGTVQALKNFAEAYGLRQTEAEVGFVSDGSQELALMYDPERVQSVEHVPGGGRGQSPAFNEEFHVDADGDEIEEIYRFYRPPLEAEITAAASRETFRLILAHAKSKGVFDPMDRLHYQQESLANRKKIFAECMWIRQRVEEWMDEGHRVAVMGDFNDGPGIDFYERQFGKTGVEIVMGNLFDAGRILDNAYERPRWTGDGWVPYTASFEAPFGRGYLEVPLDYVLATEDLEPGAGQVWNPDRAEELEEALYEASDHFPVSMTIEGV